RLSALREGLGRRMDGLIIATCPHGEDGSCACAKPGTGLIDHVLAEHGLSPEHGWYIGGDQPGVVTGRTAGLKTVRLGPAGEDRLSSIHRPDYEARDLLDASNHIMFEVT
ncbi:MAG TPA: HAD hydrolase-like protein, partial [Aeromicrobium sp.]|nr:HAD hydrolase-like protein [Aeromicrobium sp.]